MHLESIIELLANALVFLGLFILRDISSRLRKVEEHIQIQHQKYSNAQKSMLFLIGLSIFALTGCSSLPDEQIIQTSHDINAIGDSLSPVTGGVSSLVTLIISNIAVSAVAINRAIVAHRRK
jgi:hypothetical protein